VRGTPVPVIRGIRVNADGGAVEMALADTGVLAYMAEPIARRQLMWVDRDDGKEYPVAAEPRAYSNPRVSPDGTRIAVTMRDEGRDVWILDILHRRLRQFTSDTSPNFLAVWLDDHRLAFSAIENGTTQVFVRSADGSDAARRLTNRPHHTFPAASSRDGSMLFLQTFRGASEGAPEIELLPVQNPQARGTTQPLVNGINPAPSPDGHWLAYQRSNKIYVRPLPLVADPEHLLTPKGGTAPVWARDGSKLFFWSETGGSVSIMAVSIAPGPPSNWGAPRPVARGPYVQISTDTQYDEWNGRFLVMKSAVPTGMSTRDEIVIVQNWFEELKRLVPTK
jgi:Tol biopolymer transport system component